MLLLKISILRLRYVLIVATILSLILLLKSRSYLSRKVSYLGACWRTQHLMEKLNWMAGSGSEDCLCKDNDSTNFLSCYAFHTNPVSPWKSPLLFGQPFECDKVRSAQKMVPIELNDDQRKLFVPSQKFTFVTAASDNHFVELERLVANLDDVFNNTFFHKLVIYSLDLSLENLNFLQDSFDWPIIKDFPFASHSVAVKRNLYTYQWKIFLLAEITQEFEHVLWLDTSVLLHPNSKTYLTKLIPLDTAVDDQLAPNVTSAITAAPGNQTLLPERPNNDILLFLNPKHSILAATHPDLFAFFPTDLDVMPRQVMYASGLIYLRWSRTVRTILQWATVCALHEQCIAPAGSVIRCHWNKTNNQWVSGYSCCHRFDQSLLNLLLANHFAFNTSKYYSNQLSFTIQRDFFNY